MSYGGEIIFWITLLLSTLLLRPLDLNILSLEMINIRYVIYLPLFSDTSLKKFLTHKQNEIGD